MHTMSITACTHSSWACYGKLLSSMAGGPIMEMIKEVCPSPACIMMPCIVHSNHDQLQLQWPVVEHPFRPLLL